MSWAALFQIVNTAALFLWLVLVFAPRWRGMFDQFRLIGVGGLCAFYVSLLTIAFTIGAVDAGPVHGFAAPGGHGELGLEHGTWRIHLEADGGLWSIESRKTESGSLQRIGLGLRWYGWDLGGGIRSYGSLGIGRHQLSFAEIDVVRNDIAFGMGFAQQAKIGGMRIGGNFGLRLLLANPSASAELARVVCRGSCVAPTPASQHMDFGLMLTMGFEVGQ
jgi:hypothetical protein